MKHYIFALITSFPFFFFAQTPLWIARQSMPGTGNRTFTASFAIGNKIYTVGGKFSNVALADVWEYNVTSDSWTKKADFPGGPRSGATAFTIGAKGYLMCGSNSNLFFNDVWEYETTTDTWTKKTDFPGGARHEALGFSIAAKGYFGTGYVEVVGPNSTFKNAFSDFWEYNPAADAWIQMANIPGATRGWAVGFSAAGKGYAGLGGSDTQTLSYNDFYEYNPATNTWITKSNYPLSVADAMCFAYNSEIHICGGINFSNGAATSLHYKYNALTNSWTSLPALAGGATMGGTGVTAANRAFVGTGYNSAFVEKNDWWEFSDPLLANVSSALQNRFSVKVFPNPGIGIFTLDLSEMEGDEITNVFVSTTGGEPVPFNRQYQGKVMEVQLPPLVSGVYILTVETKLGVAKEKLLVR